MPDEAKEDGAEETRAAIDGGMSEATSGFLEQATSSNIWVSMSRESAGFCFSKLSKASFSCAIAFCTCDTNSSRRGGQRVTCVHACTKDMNMQHLLVLMHAKHPREHWGDHERNARRRCRG